MATERKTKKSRAETPDPETPKRGRGRPREYPLNANPQGYGGARLHIRGPVDLMEWIRDQPEGGAAYLLRLAEEDRQRRTS